VLTNYVQPNFNEISESTDDVHIYFLFCCAILKSHFRFDVDLCIFIDMSLNIDLPNFIKIEPPTAELWRQIDFSRWRQESQKSTSVMLLVMALIWEDGNLLACQISMKCLNPRQNNKTTSGFGKRTAAILTVYCRYRF